MKLLFDENLSRKLVVQLAELYPYSAHVAELGLLEGTFGNSGCQPQLAGGSACPTKAQAILGPPPKVVWLRRWTHPTRDAERVLRREAIRMTEFAAAPNPRGPHS